MQLHNHALPHRCVDRLNWRNCTGENSFLRPGVSVCCSCRLDEAFRTTHCDCRRAGRTLDDDEEDESARRPEYDCAALLVVARGWRKVEGRGELLARRRKHCELLMLKWARDGKLPLICSRSISREDPDVESVSLLQKQSV